MTRGNKNEETVKMSEEYQVEFVEKIQRTGSAISFRFSRPENLFFVAGQYMLINLGQDLVHPLSLSSCPEESLFIEITKRMTDSHFCQRLESLAKGDAISVKGPEGKFTLEESKGDFILLAGGIGITTIRSILKSREIQKKNGCRITLIHGNKDRNDIAFREELENLKLSNFKLVNVLNDNTGMAEADKGFIPAKIISRESEGLDVAKYLISGPPALVEGMKKELETINVNNEHIQTDVFIGYD